MQELLDEAAREARDLLGRRRVDLAQFLQRPLDFRLADAFRASPEGGEQRLDVELAVAATELRNLFFDDQLDLRNLAETGRDRLVETGAQVVDVEQPNALHFCSCAMDIRGNGEIDEHERTACSPLHRGRDDRLGHDRRFRTGRGHCQIRPGERIGEILDRVRRRAERGGRVLRARMRAVHHRDLADVTTAQGLQRLQRDPARADDECPLRPQIAEHALREREGHRARRRRVRADRGLRTSAPTRGDRGAKEQLEDGPRRPVLLGVLEGLANLPEDLRFAEHERVQAGGDTREMQRDVLSRVDVEVIQQRGAVDAVRLRELVDQHVAPFGDALDEVRVQLDAIAGGKSCVLVDLGTPVGSESERAEPLAQLDGSRAVADTEADEAIHEPCHFTRRVRKNDRVRALGIDVGGTFTDAVLVEDGTLRTAKVPTQARQEESVLAAAAAVGATDIDRFTHGTTIATNALLERRGARTAFVTSAGFEHLLHLRRQTRAHLYKPCVEHPPPLVPLERCVGVAGRMAPEGELRPLDLSTLPELDAEAIAVCLLLSFRHPEHEQAVAEQLRRRYPDAHVVASIEIAPEFREYERASTTTVDAYLGPLLARYLRALGAASTAHGLPEPLVMRSSGGLATLDEAAAHAAYALLSGPAAGAVGAGHLAKLAGFDNVLAFDMGGTSTDVCAVIDGQARREHERSVGGLPVRLPTLAVHTVGAGGGSVVWLDAGGALRVGPESAGAEPGPACYGRGGTQPTVTDANLLLDRLPAELPGGIRLDADAARRALAGLDPAAVIEVVNAEMVRALRVVSVEQGLDPRDFALVAFGGAGPLHACALADELEIGTVLVPAAAGLLSAVGLVAAEERIDAVRSYVEPLVEVGELPSDGEADLRYRGQSFELTIALGPGLVERFHAAHAERYGYAEPSRPLELIAVRTAERRPAPKVEITGPRRAASGPELVLLEGATVWVADGWAGETDTQGTLVLRKRG